MLAIIAAIKESKKEIEKLKLQLAKGEITQEEYEDLKRKVAENLEKKNKVLH